MRAGHPAETGPAANGARRSTQAPHSSASYPDPSSSAPPPYCAAGGIAEKANVCRFGRLFVLLAVWARHAQYSRSSQILSSASLAKPLVVRFLQGEAEPGPSSRRHRRLSRPRSRRSVGPSLCRTSQRLHASSTYMPGRAKASGGSGGQAEASGGLAGQAAGQAVRAAGGGGGGGGGPSSAAAGASPVPRQPGGTGPATSARQASSQGRAIAAGQAAAARGQAQAAVVERAGGMAQGGDEAGPPGPPSKRHKAKRRRPSSASPNHAPLSHGYASSERQQGAKRQRPSPPPSHGAHAAVALPCGPAVAASAARQLEPGPAAAGGGGPSGQQQQQQAGQAGGAGARGARAWLPSRARQPARVWLQLHPWSSVFHGHATPGPSPCALGRPGSLSPTTC
jgi:hypothetical protein